MLVKLSLRRNLKNILHDNFHCAWHQHNRLARVLEQLSVGSLADGMMLRKPILQDFVIGGDEGGVTLAALI